MPEPTLRSIGSDSFELPGARTRDPEPSGGRVRFRVVLVALALAVVLLAWSRLELSRTTQSLEGEISTLRAELTSLRGELGARDLLIQAQRERIDHVRDQLGALQRQLAEPYPEFGN